jgi:hypothetical protein
MQSAAGMAHPEAQGIDGMGWFTAEQLRAGVRRIKSKAQAANSSSSSSHTAAADSSSSTVDSSPEQTSTAADAGTAMDSLDVEEAGEEEQEGEVSRVVPEVPPFAEVLSAVQDGSQPLQLHMPVLMAQGRIVNWLERLARDVAPAVGLHIKRDSAEEQQQQQQQQGGSEHLQAPAVWVLRLPSKWAAFEPVAGGADAAEQASKSSISISSTHGQAFLSTGSSSSSASACTAGRSSASKHQTGSSAAAADTAAAVELCEGEMQRWAIGVWSGQHARRQQQ